MTKNLLPDAVAAVLFAICFNYIAYFGFTTNYTKNVFSKETFEQQYNKGIYRYRVLSNYLLLKTYDALDKQKATTETDRRITFLEKTGTNTFYQAYFTLNTIFLALTAIALVLLFQTTNLLQINRQEQLLLTWFILLLIGFSQFVVTPYDVSSYFIQVVIMLIFFKFFQTHRLPAMIILSLLIFLYSLNRESAALSLAFLAMLIWLRDGLKKAFFPVLCLTASFLAAYLSLRLIMEGSAKTFEDLRLMHNLTYFPNIIGIACWILFFYLSMQLSISRQNRLLIVGYHLFCIPYITVCIFTGIMFEIRLYLPILISTLILSRLRMEDFKYQPRDFFSVKSLSSHVTAFFRK